MTCLDFGAYGLIGLMSYQSVVYEITITQLYIYIARGSIGTMNISLDIY